MHYVIGMVILALCVRYILRPSVPITDRRLSSTRQLDQPPHR